MRTMSAASPRGLLAMGLLMVIATVPLGCATRQQLLETGTDFRARLDRFTTTEGLNVKVAPTGVSLSIK